MRGVIYTAIAGGYDRLVDPIQPIPGVDYVCFSDSRVHTSQVWKRMPFDWSHSDPSRVAKRVKILPHQYLSRYAWSLWVDGNVSITGDLRGFLDQHLGTHPLLAFKHPRRSCIYLEAQECVNRRKDAPALIAGQIERYQREGMPAGYGLSENSVLLRDHESSQTVELMEQWWQEIEKGSRRDQLSLSVVLWRKKLQPRFFFEGARLLYELPYFRRRSHGAR